MSNNKLRRRCFKCGKRVSLKIVETEEGLFLACPNCLAKARYWRQDKYEARKKFIIS